MRLLIAADEKALARTLTVILEKNGYSTDVVYTGTDALAYFETGIYDGAILDVMMPGTDSLSVLKTIRAAGNMTPVLILTGKLEIDDMVEGLDAGANDYVTKPFVSRELLARIRAMTRNRSPVAADSVLRYGNIRLDRATHELYARGGVKAWH